MATTPTQNHQDSEIEKDALLNSLKEEWNNIKIKSPFIMNNVEIIREIFVTVKNRLETDPLVTDKAKVKKSKENKDCQGGCSVF